MDIDTIVPWAKSNLEWMLTWRAITWLFFSLVGFMGAQLMLNKAFGLLKERREKLCFLAIGTIGSFIVVSALSNMTTELSSKLSEITKTAPQLNAGLGFSIWG